MKNRKVPGEENNYLSEHVDLLLRSLHRLTGKRLFDEDDDPDVVARKIFHAPFAFVSHDTSEDPVFNYANMTALKLFEMTWEEFTTLPSRKSAEPLNRKERAKLLRNVTDKGYIDDYSGVRISSTGKRFRINNAIVWNIIDSDGKYRGQAAMFDNWECL